MVPNRRGIYMTFNDPKWDENNRKRNNILRVIQEKKNRLNLRYVQL